MPADVEAIWLSSTDCESCVFAWRGCIKVSLQVEPCRGCEGEARVVQYTQHIHRVLYTQALARETLRISFAERVFIGATPLL